MSLSPSQRLAKRLVSPARFAAIEADSRGWRVDGTCGYRSNVWEMGGIRTKARGVRHSWGKCPGCGKRHRFRISRAAD